MELKDYQQRVVADLSAYLSEFVRTESTAGGYEAVWEARGVKVGPDGLPFYKHTIPGVPHVCAKVPTAGGKTFIAVNALAPILETMRTADPNRSDFVVWLVPSLTILDQTVKNLSDAEHPYHQRLAQQFRNRVQVYEKRELLMGAGFSADSVRGQLSIVVMTFDSLRARNKEDRKIFQDNGYLASFGQPSAQTRDDLLPEHDSTALINVIRTLRPVVVVDESHNAESELSVEMLKNLNPWFILDLTATPRQNSNIISYVDAMALKKQHMVKLPVIVANRGSQEEVIEAALVLRNQLENAAKAEETAGGNYIRPIILFQAQPRTGAENATFEKVRQMLINLRVPADQIAVKTAERNELKGVDLLSSACPIRYIITVNALKEGWDCPFAYVLATLADKNSAVDVEQILGRVLRMPHVRAHGNELLNVSYVLTASTKFQETLNHVVKGLNRAGFTERDHRVVNAVNPLPPLTSPAQLSLPVESPLPMPNGSMPTTAEGGVELAIDTTKISAEWDLQTPSTPGAAPPSLSFVAALTAQAQSQSAAFTEQAKRADPNVPAELEAKMNRQRMKEIFRDQALGLRLPQFVIQVQTGGWFSEGEDWQFFDEAELLKDFRLSTQDATVEFTGMDTELYSVDLEATGKDDYRPAPFKMKEQQRKWFAEHVLVGTHEAQVRKVRDQIFNSLGNQYPIPDVEVKKWLLRVVESMTPEQMRDCLEHEAAYKSKIKSKIDELKNVEAERRFLDRVELDGIKVEPRYALTEHIEPAKTSPTVIKSLYGREGDMGAFEHDVIDAIANLDSVEWWHRNLSRGRGFHINGFLNHYPDFIVKMKSGRTLVIETKGDDRDNSDSERKARMGEIWAAKAQALGSPGFRYMMVFGVRAPEYGLRLSDALIRIAKL